MPLITIIRKLAMEAKAIMPRGLMGVAFLIPAPWLIGCGTPPVKAIANVEMAINEARENYAKIHAPLELMFAENKLQQAKTAMEDGEYDEARLLAEQALLDARLAGETARAKKDGAYAQEIRKTVDALHNELLRAK